MTRKIVFVDIDTQFDFMSPDGALYVEGSERIVPILKKLTGFAEENRITIISSIDTHTEDDPEFKQFPPHCIKGTPGHRKIPETLLEQFTVVDYKPLKINPGRLKQLLIEKNSFSPFTNSNTDLILKDISPAAAICYGVATDYCVKAGVIGLLDRNISVHVVDDAIRAVDPESGRKAIDDMKACGAMFINSGKIIEKLRNGKIL